VPDGEDCLYTSVPPQGAYIIPGLPTVLSNCKFLKVLE